MFWFMDRKDSAVDDDDGLYEVVEEHRGGAHIGGWYLYCPLCVAMDDSEIIIVHCHTGKCHNTTGVAVEQFRMDAEYQYECMECMTGVSDLCECVDCGKVLTEDEQFHRVKITDTAHMRRVDHHTVCFDCFMDDPGDAPLW